MINKAPFKHRLACKLLKWTQKLTFQSAWSLSGLLATLFFPINGGLQTTIRDNIERVYPKKSAAEQTKLCKEAFRHTIAFGLEAGSVWMRPLEYSCDQFSRIHGLALFEQALASGKGIIFLLPHLGNWEMANQFVAPRTKLVALYKPHPNQQLEQIIYAARSRSGVIMAPTDRRGVSQILRHLKSGGATIILPDQVPAASGGVQAPFFGQDAATPTLLPKLANSSGAHILGLVCARDGQGQFEVHISKAPEDIADSDIFRATTAMNAYIEKLVNEFPSQYQWSYNRFK